MRFIPSEFAIGGVGLPPLLIASILGVTPAVLTAFLLNRYRLSWFFLSPPLVFLAPAILKHPLILRPQRRRPRRCGAHVTFR